MTILELAAIVGSIGALSGVILHILQRRLLNQSLTVSVYKGSKEAEQLEQEISSKYALQVKKWIDDLEEIKQRHDLALEKKDDLIHALKDKAAIDSAEIAVLRLKLAQCGRAHRRLFVEMGIPYWECSKDGQLIYANGYWLTLFGLENDEAMGEGWLKSIPEEDRKKLLVQWYSRVIDESDGSIEFTIDNSVTGESYRVRALYAVKFDDHGEVYKIIGTTTKITGTTTDT